VVDLTQKRDEECFEQLVFGMFDQERYTQDSPVLFDVYSRYGCGGGEPLDLLLTPDWSRKPSELAVRLRGSFGIPPVDSEHDGESSVEIDSTERSALEERLLIAFNQSVVAVELTFRELVRHVLPLSWWWNERLVPIRGTTPTELFTDEATAGTARTQLVRALDELIRQRDAKSSDNVRPGRPGAHWLIRPELVWASHLFYLIENSNVGRDDDPARDPEAIADWFIDLVREIPLQDGYEGDAWVFSVNLNRKIDRSTHQSVPTTKADVVRRTFEVTGAGIRWAVIDSGIDATHVAFRRRDPVTGLPYTEAFDDGRDNTRIKATFDFSRIRKQLSQSQRKGIIGGRLLDWKAVELDLESRGQSLAVPHTDIWSYRPPSSSHGTHVAGIIGANWDPSLDADDPIGPPVASTRPSKPVVGMCPDIELYDLRVFDGSIGDEFAVMSALQFVRHLNGQYDNIEVHGANLSLSVFHDVRNFACGRSPVCEESSRLVANGVVVVAAAGNSGRAIYTSTQGRSEGYRTAGIADPGNAEAVITVGSTHREEPHTYGVSYFSSRGPTGDGRLKPDLVAPGEKVYSTVPGDRVERQDGTSQAAPHVSGAAALLMCRHRELIGDPMRVKKVLVETATDLGRDRAYQGAGLVDVMRAMQEF
jgi:serine protease AprX